MYKLLIVDDEEIEREGMARFIDWEQFGIEMVGTAWNGAEGLEKIHTLKPDIVITDIKMPVMNGIDLIRETKKQQMDVEFIVLSGYGEYEFTSQAMQEGIRHYLLKPCDEEQILKVLQVLEKEIEEKREKTRVEKKYKDVVYHLLPRAKEQIFRDMLLNREQNQNDYALFLEEYGTEEQESVVLAFYTQNEFDPLEKFILQNILTELLGEKNVYLFTQIQNTIYLLINKDCLKELDKVVERLRIEFNKLDHKKILAAVSNPAKLHQVNQLYVQIQELIHIGIVEKREEVLRYSIFQQEQSSQGGLIDYEKVRNAVNYSEILRELKASFTKMLLEGFSLERQEQFAGWLLKVLYGEKFSKTGYEADTEEEKSWELMKAVAHILAEKKNIDIQGTRENAKLSNILEETFHYIDQQELSIQYLAKQILFMNEDYFSRIFTKTYGQKFSSYLLEQRIYIAEQLFQYQPEWKIGMIAEAVGYAPDGQYFSKAFRKVTGMTPTQYKK